LSLTATTSESVFTPYDRLASRGPGAGANVLRFLRRKPLGAFGAAMVLLVIACALFAPQIAPYHFDKHDFLHRLKPPITAGHLLGTDDQGRDILSRVIYGARVSAFVGFGSVLIATLVAGTIGVVSGYAGGKLDTLVQRLVDIWIAFPALILLITITAIFGTPTSVHTFGAGPLKISLDPSQLRAAQIIFALGLIFTGGSSRVIRSAVISVRGNQYIEGARTVGSGNLRILLHYIVPNVMPTLIILASVQLGAAILLETSLGFLGFGIPPPVPSWGSMLAGVAQHQIRQDPWLSVWPGVAIALTVFGFNMLGDALRDVLDPRLRGAR